MEAARPTSMSVRRGVSAIVVLRDRFLLMVIRKRTFAIDRTVAYVIRGCLVPGQPEFCRRAWPGPRWQRAGTVTFYRFRVGRDPRRRAEELMKLAGLRNCQPYA